MLLVRTVWTTSKRSQTKNRVGNLWKDNKPLVQWSNCKKNIKTIASVLNNEAIKYKIHTP